MEIPDTKWVLGGDGDLKYVKRLGGGGYGDVHAIRNLVTNEEFARKILGPDENGGIPQEARVINELGLNQEGGAHANLIMVLRHGWLPLSRYYYIDMELCDFDLHNYIQRWQLYDASGPNGKRSPDNIFNIARQIAAGIKFIHMHEKVHRDLKPKNILYSTAQQKWKIADLGITTQGSTEMSRETLKVLGTHGYCAPEFITSPYPPKYTNRVDIWAFGCIIYELSTSQKAFINDIDTSRFAQLNEFFPRERFPFAGPSAELLFSLIKRMLAIDPRTRPGPAEVDTALPKHVFNDPMRLDAMAYNLNDSLEWLIQERGNILIRDRIAHAYGTSSSQVHEVLEASTGRVFVRKVTNAFGKRWTQTNIETKLGDFKRLLFDQDYKSCAYVVDIQQMFSRPGSNRGSFCYFTDMELCKTNLQKFIKNPASISGVESNIWKIMLHIALGAQFIHDHGMVIRDLTPSRVLYSTQQFGLWKIGDISLVASQAPENHEEFSEDPSEAGTEGYRAPELIQNHQFNTKVDIWAMGCILYALVYSKPLFTSDFDTIRYAQYQKEGALEGDVINLNSYLTPFGSYRDKWNIKQYLLGMFQECPKDRPRAEELAEHAFQRMIDCKAPWQSLQTSGD